MERRVEAAPSQESGAWLHQTYVQLQLLILALVEYRDMSVESLVESHK